LSTVLPVALDQPLRESDPQSAHYEKVPFPFRSVASITARLNLLADLNGGPAANTRHDSVLPQLTVKIRQLMNCDFAIVGKSHSDGAEFQVSAFDGAVDIVPNKEAVGFLGQ